MKFKFYRDPDSIFWCIDHKSWWGRTRRRWCSITALDTARIRVGNPIKWLREWVK